MTKACASAFTSRQMTPAEHQSLASSVIGVASATSRPQPVRDEAGHPPVSTLSTAPTGDVALSNAFGTNTLAGFKVWTEEIPTG